MSLTHDPAVRTDGARDFDFLFGRWRIRNRKLAKILCGSNEWIEFDATSECRPILGGAGNEDEFRTDQWENYVGASFRFFDPGTSLWSIFWANNRVGMLLPPQVGRFDGDVGTFDAADTYEGRPVVVRYLWSDVRSAHPRWEQRFSPDGGATWETKWTMEFRRAT